MGGSSPYSEQMFLYTMPATWLCRSYLHFGSCHYVLDCLQGLFAQSAPGVLMSANYQSVVHPMQGFAMPRHLLWVVICPSLRLPQTFPEQLGFGCHLADVLLNLLGCVQDGSFDTNQAPSTLLPPGVQSLDIGLGVEASVHCEEFAGLHVSSLHLLLCPAHYAGRVSDDW